MSAAVRAEDGVRELLREAATWRATGLIFRRPFEGRSQQVAALARESADGRLAALADSASAWSEGLYHAWLGPGGPVSPRVVSYRPVEDPGRILAEIAAFHEAFGYRARGEDPPDHAAVAVDFVAYLALKEAYATVARCEEDARITREARERFVERHVRPLARGMRLRLEKADGAELLPAVLLLCTLAGAAAASTDGDDPEQDSPFLRPGLGGESFECGAADDATGGACRQGCPLGGRDLA